MNGISVPIKEAQGSSLAPRKLQVIAKRLFNRKKALTGHQIHQAP